MSDNLQQFCYPMLVSQVSSVPDSKSMFLQSWLKYDTLAEDRKAILGSEQLAEFIHSHSMKVALSDEETESFSRSIRMYFFGSLDESSFALKIKEILSTDMNQAKDIVSQIKTLDVSQTKSDSGVRVVESEMLSLTAATEKYPQMLKQLVTGGKIITKPFLNPLSPTVKNWITVYEKIMGAQKHDQIKRGEFLYRSQACRGLSEIDRMKVSQLLKSRDEGTALKISTEKGGIIWQRKAVTQMDSQRSQGGSTQKTRKSQQMPITKTALPQKKSPIAAPPAGAPKMDTLAVKENIKSDSESSSTVQKKSLASLHMESISRTVPKQANQFNSYKKSQQSQRGGIKKSETDDNARGMLSAKLGSSIPQRKQLDQTQSSVSEHQETGKNTVKKQPQIKKDTRQHSAAGSIAATSPLSLTKSLGDTTKIQKFSNSKTPSNQIIPRTKRPEPVMHFSSGQTLPTEKSRNVAREVKQDLVSKKAFQSKSNTPQSQTAHMEVPDGQMQKSSTPKPKSRTFNIDPIRR